MGNGSLNWRYSWRIASVLCIAMVGGIVDGQNPPPQPNGLNPAPLCDAYLPEFRTAHLGQAELDTVLSPTSSTSPKEILKNARLFSCNINASLAGRDMSNAILQVAAKKVNFSGATAIKTQFIDSTLDGAIFNGAHLSGAKFRGVTSLRGATFQGSFLDKAVFEDYVDMSGADLSGADLESADLDPAPDKTPDINHFAHAKNIETLRSPFSQAALLQMRKDLGGISSPVVERKLTFAIQRSIQERQAGICWTGYEYNYSTRVRIAMRLGACGQFLVRAVVLDATCAFGLSYWRPIIIIAYIWLSWSLIYALIISGRGATLLRIAVRNTDGKERTTSIRCLASIGRKRNLSPAEAHIWRLRIAAYFSLVNVFNITFHDIDIGGWIKMISKHNYRFISRGWIRSLSGIQSLLGLSLLAIWLINCVAEALW